MEAATKPFDLDAQERIATLFRNCPSDEYFTALHSYAPRPGPERAAFEKFEGWGLYDAGDFVGCRTHLLHALRLSAGSTDRPLLLGILGDTYLRLGQFARGERCLHRALSEGSARDPGHYLEGGLRATLARLQVLSGQLSAGMENYIRVQPLIDESSPIWIPLFGGIAQTHLYRGDLDGAEDAIQTARMSPAGAQQHGWALVSVEVPLAIALGDVDRADAVVRTTRDLFSETASERIRHLMTEAQASVLHACGRFGEAEELLRGIISRSVVGGRNSDAIGSASRGLAEALMAQDRHEEALEAARHAAQLGSMDDRAEWVTALRLKAECLHALGTTSEARRALREAMTAHDFAQYDVERANLEQFAARATGRSRVHVDRLPWTASSPPASIRRFTLRSGRVFLTWDGALVEGIQAASRTDLPVLIEGETGTGKELAAGLVHELGARANRPLVVVDCTSLPEDLAEAELFGAKRGAYTGAVQDRVGLLAQADGGTAVLDELPELAPAVQAKLLRVIQEGTYRRLGESHLRRVHVRFIATTNWTVSKLLRTGRMRADLFYRLGGHRIAIRPLRARREEVGPIAMEVAKRSGLGGVAWDAIHLLEGQPWPGNVRQLEMIVRLAASSCRPGSLLRRAHLEHHLSALDFVMESELQPDLGGSTLRSNRAAAERALLERVLSENGGVVAHSARALGISRQAFYKAMRRAGLSTTG